MHAHAHAPAPTPCTRRRRAAPWPRARLRVARIARAKLLGCHAVPEKCLRRPGAAWPYLAPRRSAACRGHLAPSHSPHEQPARCSRALPPARCSQAHTTTAEVATPPPARGDQPGSASRDAAAHVLPHSSDDAADDVPELEAAPIAPTSTRPPPPACPTGGDGDEGCGRVEGEVEGETTQQRRGALHVHAVVVWPAGSDGHPRLAP